MRSRDSARRRPHAFLANLTDSQAIEKQNSDRLNKLLEEQASSLQRLEEARARGEDLEAQIRAARAESDEVKRSLADAAREKR